jgi:hypothetical protein
MIGDELLDRGDFMVITPTLDRQTFDVFALDARDERIPPQGASSPRTEMVTNPTHLALPRR